MSRREHFFHGTTADLTTGDTVLPPALSGVTHYANASGGDRRGTEYDQHYVASATESEKVAWMFAGLGADARSHVLRVAPARDQRLGLEHRRNPDHETWASWSGGRQPASYAEHISSTGFKVIGREDIKPPELWEMGKGIRQKARGVPATGRQGTLPVDFGGLHQQAGRYSGPIGDDEGNHPDMVSQRREQGRIAKQEKARQPEAPKPPPNRIRGQMRLF